VAGFIGSPAMNLLMGRISEGAFIDAGATRWPLPAQYASMEGREVVYGIRPEHLRLDPNGIEGRVHVVEPTGSETQVMLRTSMCAVMGDVSLIGAFRERITARPDEALSISPELSLVHIFDKASGQRI
jgi:multiple sugar transport system ATP-binding protein